MDSLGRTTCLTGTDTAGSTNFNAAAAKASIADVDGTVASVNTAIAAIANGTVGGLVPGVALIAKVTAGIDAITAYEVTAGAANPTFDLKNGLVAGKDGLVTKAEAQAAFTAAGDLRTAETVATSTAANSLSNANTALNVAKIGVSTAAISTYDSAVAAQKALTVGFSATPGAPGKTALENATAAAGAAETTALASLVTALGVTGSAVTFATLTAAVTKATGVAVTTYDAESLKTALELQSGVAKATLTTELAKVATFGTAAVEAVNKVAALTTAAGNVTTAEAAVGTPYVTAAKDQATAADLVVKLTALDTAVTAAKTVVDQYNTLDANVASAKAALDVFKAANIEKVSLVDISATSTAIQASAKSDVFYFGAKASATADFAIGGTTNFGAGDSIVLGSGYTFNSGALSTGNANTLEFFLVKGATGTQVVIETSAFGNANNVVDANGTVTASPSATVINLVGVTADHLSVANGVVSYV